MPDRAIRRDHAHPRIKRYHDAKARRIPMTQLASSLVREGLARLGDGDGGGSCVVREEPPADDPRGRQD